MRWHPLVTCFVIACTLPTLSCVTIKAIEIDESIPHPPLTSPPNAFDVIGEAAFRAGKLDQAGQSWHRGLNAARHQGSNEHQARFLARLFHLEEARGRYQEALQRAREGLELANEIDDQKLKAAALTNVGQALRRLARYQEAEELLTHALVLAKQTDSAGIASVAERSLGGVYQARGEYLQALESYQRSLEGAELTDDMANQARTLNDLGGLARLRAEYEDALDFYGRSLALRKQLEDVPGQGKVLGNLCLARQHLRSFDDAERRCRESMEIARRIDDRALEANNFNNLGSIFRERDEHKKALRLYQQSIEIKRQIADRAGEGRTLNNIGELYLRQSKFKKARDFLERSLTIKKKTEDKPGQVATHLNLAAVWLGLGSEAEALDQLERALALEASVGRPELRWRIFEALARFYAERSKPRLAIFYRKQAVETIQSVRSNIKNLGKRQRESYLDGKLTVYESLASLLIDEGRLLEAQQILDLLKEEEFAHFVRGDTTEGEEETATALNDSERRSADRYAELTASLIEIGRDYETLRLRSSELTEDERSRREALGEEIARAYDEFERFLETLEETLSESQGGDDRISLGELESLTAFKETLQELGEGLVAVYFLSTPDQLRVIVNAGTVSIPPFHVDHEITEEDLHQLIFDYRQTLRDPSKNPYPQASELYDHLIAPIESHLRSLEADTLLVYLAGALRYLPLAALYDEASAEYLVKRYGLVMYTPAVKQNLASEPISDWQVAAFGVSEEHGQFPPLPAVVNELDGIVKLEDSDPHGVLPGVQYLNAGFTKELLQEVLLPPGYPVLHIATHFVFNPGSEEDSFLLLGNGDELNLNELRQAHYYPLGKVDLLTLSACETGLGDTDASQGREVEGLGALAQANGAKAVLATLWEVADASTGELMQWFYRLREDETQVLTKSEALRRAQLALLEGRTDAASADTPSDGADATDRTLVPIEEPVDPDLPASGEILEFIPDPEAPYAHPYYWAPFILMGNPR